MQKTQKEKRLSGKEKINKKEKTLERIKSGFMADNLTSNHRELMNRKYSIRGGNFSKQEKISEYSGEGGASPSEDCIVFGCNTYGCLSSGRCEG